jgi:hypothetical protein
LDLLYAVRLKAGGNCWYCFLPTAQIWLDWLEYESAVAESHSQIFDTLKVKSLPFPQINQLLSRYDVAAVQSTIGDMPHIAGPVMQSDSQSLLLKIRQSSIEL